MSEKVYNPLEKINLARSIEQALLKESVHKLSSLELVQGAGVYAIYYTGTFPTYSPISKLNLKGVFEKPIYVGKAIPKGGRKGGLTKDSALTDRALARRLRNHAGSIEAAGNLKLSDFHVRHLVVDDIWIPLGENMLIERFQPLWNRVIDGFGNNAPGEGRAGQYKSAWDVLHPGRKFAEKLPDGGISAEWVKKQVDDYLNNRPLDPDPRPLARQKKQLADSAETIVDDFHSASDVGSE